MLPGWQVKDGSLWAHGKQMPVSEESELFRLLGAEYVPPEERR